MAKGGATGDKGACQWPDMEMRDPQALNSHIKVQFEDIFGEPEGAHSIDCVWKGSYCCFVGTLSCCYKTLTLCCAIPLAFCWACQFACTACYHIWYVTPELNQYIMCFVPLRKMYVLYCDTFFGPCYETCGLCLSKIVVTNQSG